MLVIIFIQLKEVCTCLLNVILFFTSFFKRFFYILLDRGERKEKERERNINVWLYLMFPTGDLAHNPGMCPDWESNQ